MTKYDIVFIDIDGTLRDNNRNISQESIDAIARVKEQGIIVVLATGRSCNYAKKVAEKINTSDYLISSNGSEVINFRTNETIFNKGIDRNSLYDIFAYCQENNVNLLLNTIKEDYQTIEESHRRTLIHFLDEIKEDVNQIVITSMNYDRMLVIPEMFKEKFPHLHLSGSSSDLKRGNRHPETDYYHDYNAENVSKATGVLELLDYLKIPVERSIAIGNSDNDISMCSVAGCGVAVANASKSLKEIADEIIGDNNENAVAEFLETLEAEMI